MSTETYDFVVVDDYLGFTVTTTDISDGTLCEVIAIRNRGIPEAQWDIENSSSGFGARFGKLHLAPREIQLDLLWTTTSESLAVTRRDALYDLFKPFDTKWLAEFFNEVGCWLQVTRADSSVRRIKCQVTGMVDMPYVSGDPFNDDAYAGKMRVNLICPNPIWEDASATTSTVSALTGTVTSTFEADRSDATWLMYPIVELTGPATTFSVTNPVGDGLVLANSVTGSETITADFNPFNKTIKDQTGALRFDLITAVDSVFMDFIVQPEWMHADDTFDYSITGGSSSAFTVSYHKAYIGI